MPYMWRLGAFVGRSWSALERSWDARGASRGSLRRLHRPKMMAGMVANGVAIQFPKIMRHVWAMLKPNVQSTWGYHQHHYLQARVLADFSFDYGTNSLRKLLSKKTKINIIGGPSPGEKNRKIKNSTNGLGLKNSNLKKAFFSKAMSVSKIRLDHLCSLAPPTLWKKNRKLSCTVN